MASSASAARRYRRVTARVRVRFSDAEGEREEIATTLGAGGLFVSTDEPLPRGTQIKVHFSLFEGGRNHEIEARVVWAKGPSDPGEYAPGMGLEFKNPEAVARLARELVEYLRRQEVAARASKVTRS
jgi:uncharacterized protein (TIGR02266 family)